MGRTLKPNPHGGTTADPTCFVCKKKLNEVTGLETESFIDFDYDVDKWVIMCSVACRDNKKLYSERVDRIKELRDGK